MGCSVLVTTFNMITHTQKRSWEAEQTMKWIQEQVLNYSFTSNVTFLRFTKNDKKIFRSFKMLYKDFNSLLKDFYKPLAI